jgi:phosphoribosylglycinamide formyltransferase 1
MFGGGVPHHPVGRRPGEAEELGEERLFGVQQAALVPGVRAALVREQETRAGDGRACPSPERLADVAPLRDSTGEEQWVVGWQRGSDSLQQLQRGQVPSHVAARLDTLDDHGVRAGGVSGAGLGDRTALMDPGAAGAPLRPAPESYDHVRRCCRFEPAPPGEGEQQVHRDRSIRQPPRCGQLPPDRLRPRDRDRPQPAGVGNRRGELVPAETTTHPSLDDRGLDAKAVEECHVADNARVPDAYKLVVLASGSGTNLQAILDTLHGRGEIEVVGVGSDKRDARALERARRRGVETAVFPRDEYADREARDVAMAEWIEGRGADLVVLAGYMQLLSPAFVARFRNRVVNVHPALLPDFPGLDAIGQALAAGVETTGVTVHFVDEGVDTGPSILQREVPVPADRDRARLEAAVHAVEHELYPEAIRMIAQGRARIDASDPGVVVIDE